MSFRPVDRFQAVDVRGYEVKREGKAPPRNSHPVPPPPLPPMSSLPKEALYQKARTLIQARKAPLFFTWRQFALMNNTFHIRGSEWEGANPLFALQAYVDYLSSVEQSPFFSSPPEVHTLHKELLQLLERCRAVLLVSQMSTSLVLQQLNAQLHAYKVAYLPAAYGGTEESPGHAFTLKIASSPSHVIVTILNLGEGAQHHQDLSVTATHVKTSLWYTPIKISHAEWKKGGETFLNYFLSYGKTPLEDSAKTPYSMEELYDLLHVLGEIDPDEMVRHRSQILGKTQFVGDCPEKVVRHILLDYMRIEKKSDAFTVDQVFLELHLASLFAASYNLKNNPTRVNRLLFKQAVQEWGTLLILKKEQLKPQEYEQASALVTEFLRLHQAYLEELPKPEVVVQAPLPLVFKNPGFPKGHSLALQTYLRDAKTSFLFTFNPATFKKDFSTWLESGPSAREVFAFVSVLPIPKQANDFWNTIAREDISEIIATLWNVGIKYQSDFNSLILMTLYCVVDKLTRLMPQNAELVTIHCPFLTSAFEPFLIFRHAEEEQRYLRVKAYFASQPPSAVTSILSVKAHVFSFSPAGQALQYFVSEFLRVHTPSREEWDLRSYTTNAAVLHDSPTLKKYRGLVLAFQHPSLKWALALEWMVSHLHALQDKTAQNYLETCLFSPGVIGECLQSDPENATYFVECFEKGFEFYGKRKEFYQAEMFLASLAVNFESYRAHYLGQPFNRAVLEVQKTRLKTLLAHFDYNKNGEEEYAFFTILTHLLHLEIHNKLPTEASLKEFYILFFTYSCCNYACASVCKDYDLRRLHEIATLQAQRLENYLKAQGAEGPKIKARLLKAVIEAFSLNRNPEDVDVDFISGIISCKKSGSRLTRLLEEEWSAFEKENVALKNELKFCWFNRLLIGGVEVFYTDTSNTLYVKKTSNGKKVQLLRVPKSHKELVTVTEKPPFYPQLFTYTKLSENAIVATCQKTWTPHHRLDLKGAVVTMTRLGAEGVALEWKRVNLQGVDKFHPLHSKTVRFANPDAIFCFINEKTEAVEELHFMDLNLRFISKEGHLYSVEYPGYFIVSQTLPFLGEELSKEVLILRHANKTFKVIFPLTSKEKHLFEKKKENLRLPTLPSLFVFDLPTFNASFQSSFLADHLFLVYFFKIRGEFEKARKTLENIPPLLVFDEKASSFLMLFLHLEDTSAESIALNLKLLLFCVERFSQLTHEMQSVLNGFFKQSAASWYPLYLKAMEAQSVGCIPKQYRLTETEEARLLAAFEREKVESSLILKTRRFLLHSIDRTWDVTFKEEELSVAPSVFATLLTPQEIADARDWEALRVEKAPALPTYPVRLSEQMLVAHFPTLYERARHAKRGEKDPMDFTLLAVLKVQTKNETVKKMAHLLFYVRHFQAHFPTFASGGGLFNALLRGFSAAPTLPSLAELFACVGKLQTHPEYLHFVQKVLNKKVPLKNNHVVKVALPPKTQTVPLLTSSPLKYEQRPFEDLSQLIFMRGTPRAFRSTRLFDPAFFVPTEKGAVEDYEKAFKEMASSQEFPYEFQPAKAAAVSAALLQRVRGYETERRHLEESLHQALNVPSSFCSTMAAELDFELALNSGQTYLLNAEILMRQCLLRRDQSLLLAERPSMQPQAIQLALQHTLKIYYLLVLEAVANEALLLMKQGLSIVEENQLFELLNTDFGRSLQDHPEILYFKVKVGKLPRSGQLAPYMAAVEGLTQGENRNWKQDAGSGKSTFMLPLLLTRLQATQALPVVFSTPAMLPTEKETLRATLTQLSIGMKVLNIQMQAELTLNMLQLLFEDVKASIQNRHVLMTTPQTFYSLWLLSFTEPPGRKAELLRMTLGLLKKYGIAFFDESHRTLDPYTQAIYGVGSLDSLPLEEQAQLIALVQKVMEQKEGISLKALQKVVAQSLSNDPQTQLFLTERSAKSPPNPPPLLNLCRHFIVDLLPSLMALKLDFDHLSSPEQGGIESPAYHKSPTHAQFSNPYLTFVLTVTATLARGLNASQREELVTVLKERDILQQEMTLEKGHTPSSALFKKWTTCDLRTIHVKDARLVAFLKHNKEAIFWYLKEIVLPRIGVSSQQLSASPSELVAGFKNALAFSATPLQQEAYPEAVQGRRPNPLFEARVIATGLEERNQRFLLTKGPSAFFKLMKENPASFASITVLIDASGFLCKEQDSNVQIAKKWLEASTLDAVLFYREEDEKLCLAFRDRMFTLQGGSDQIGRELVTWGIQLDRLHVGTYYDAAHAESANILQRVGARAVVFADEGLTLSHAIQAMMRLRGFLNPAMKQTICWAMTPFFASKIKFRNNAEALFSYFLKIDLKMQRGAVLLAALQEIRFKVEKYALQTLPKGAPSFREKVSRSELLDTQSRKEFTGRLFIQKVKEYKRRFHVLFLKAALKGELRQVIKRTVKLLPVVEVETTKKANQHIHQKMVMKKSEMQVVSRRDVNAYEAEVYVPPLKLTDPHFMNSLKPEALARSHFKTPFLSDRFYIESNQIKTAKLANESVNENYLKPFSFLLVVVKEGQFYVQALSLDTAALYQKELKACPENLPLTHKAFLLTSSGKLFQEGSGALKISKQERLVIQSHPLMQDILSDVALLNGRLTLKQKFAERVRGAEKPFRDLWEKLQKASAHPISYGAEMLNLLVREV